MIALRLMAFISAFLLVACSGAATPTPAPTAEVTEPAIAMAATAAGELTCDQLITQAIEQVGETCDEMGRNQVCYGNRLVEVAFREGAEAGDFAASGDVVDISLVERLHTAPLDETEGVWGIAVLKAQANLEDVLPGQNVTFLLYGDATLENPSPDMQAVRLQTGLGSVECENAPPAAIVIQSPQGGQVTMNINGADVTLGSTVYVTAQENAEMTLGTIEGQAIVEAFGTTQTVLPGAQVRLPVDEDFEVSGPPSEPEPFTLEVVEAAPVTLLEQPIELPSPIPTQPTRTPTTVPPTQTPAPTATATVFVSPTPCVPREDWTGSYTVQSGDTLSRIAQRAGVTQSELQAANCIEADASLSAGQTLRVPLVATPTETTAPAATTQTGGATLRADRTTVQAGECAVISWDAADARQIFFEGQPARPNSSREVCPTRTQTYTLMTVYDDGRQEPARITIEVLASAPECGNAICEQGEDALSCAGDCGAVCGNGQCEAGEDSRSCSADCQ